MFSMLGGLICLDSYAPVQIKPHTRYVEFIKLSVQGGGNFVEDTNRNRS
jgi:hypothetical protein